MSFVRGKTFNVGDDDLNYTLEELGTTIEGLFPAVQVNRVSNDADPRSYRVSFRKIKGELGFRPMVDLEQGIEELRRMITEMDILDYSDPQFSNVRLLQENPYLVFGPADDEADPELEQLHSLYRPKQALPSVQQAAGRTEQRGFGIGIRNYSGAPRVLSYCVSIV